MMNTVIDLEEPRRRKEYEAWRQSRLETAYRYADDDPDYRDGLLEIIDNIIAEQFSDFAFPQETKQQHQARIAEVAARRRRDLAPLYERLDQSSPSQEQRIAALKPRLETAQARDKAQRETIDEKGLP